MGLCQVRAAKLYLNLNPDIMKKLNEDFVGNVSEASKNRPGLAMKSNK